MVLKQKSKNGKKQELVELMERNIPQRPEKPAQGARRRSQAPDLAGDMDCGCPEHQSTVNSGAPCGCGTSHRCVTHIQR